MKKLLSVALAAVMLVSLSAAGAGGLEASAATPVLPLSLVSEISDRPADAQKFTLYNPNAFAVNYTITGAPGRLSIPESGAANPGATVFYVSDDGLAGVTLQITWLNENGSLQFAQCVSKNQYFFTVRYVDGAGAELKTIQRIMSPGELFTMTADAIWAGLERQGSGLISHSYNPKGTLTATVEYLAPVPLPYHITINYMSGGRAILSTPYEIKPGESKTIPIDTTFDDPDTSTSIIYIKLSGEPAQIIHDYAAGKKTYNIQYAIKPPTPTASYEVFFELTDASNGFILYSDKRTVLPDSSVDYTPMATITNASGTFSYALDASFYSGSSPKTIHHDHALNAGTYRYSIKYNKINTVPTTPYDISFVYLDAATGLPIAAAGNPHVLNVPVGGTVSFSAEPTVTATDGTVFHIAAGVVRNVTAQHSNGIKKYSFYYNAENAPQYAPYNITIRYVSAKTNVQLYTTTVVIPVRSFADYVVPLDYSSGGVDYVLAPGQSQLIRHTYDVLSTRRTYIAFYNVKTGDPAIDYPGGPVTPIPPVEGGDEGGEGEAVVDVDEGTIVIPDIDIPLNPGEVDIGDGETPLDQGGTPGQVGGVNWVALGAGAGLAALVIGGLLVVFLFLRKKEGDAGDISD